MVLKNLASNKDLISTKSDKGNGVVLLNKRDYISEMEHLLQDFTKLSKFDENWMNVVFKYQEKVSKFMVNLF